MPRSSKSTRASNRRANPTASAPTTVNDEDLTVSTATAPITKDETETEETVRELPFQVSITPAEDGYKPDRSPAGRKRIPSPFESILPELKGKGWQNQPHDGNVVPYETATDGTKKFNTLSSEPKDSETGEPTGIIPSVRESNARVILRELSKAVKFLNSDEGGALNLGLDVNVTETDVQFNIRDKQKRKERERTTSGEESTDGESIDSNDGDGDNGDE